MAGIKDLEEINGHISSKDACSSPPDGVERFISKQFGILFGTYTKAINKTTSRSGTHFEGRFKRKPVTNNCYFKALVAYIHQNPQKHGLIADFRDWPYSSYKTLFSDKPTQLDREATLSWFDGRINLMQYQEATTEFKGIADLV
jgi:hypothetical protein